MEILYPNCCEFYLKFFIKSDETRFLHKQVYNTGCCLLIFLLMVISPISQAKGFHKCIVDGKTNYTEKQCAVENSESGISRGTVSSIGSAEGFSVLGESDRKNLLEAEYEQAERDEQQSRLNAVQKQVNREELARNRQERQYRNNQSSRDYQKTHDRRISRTQAYQRDQIKF